MLKTRTCMVEAVGVDVVGILLAVVTLAVWPRERSAPAVEAADQMEAIGLALAAYDDSYGGLTDFNSSRPPQWMFNERERRRLGIGSRDWKLIRDANDSPWVIQVNPSVVGKRLVGVSQSDLLLKLESKNSRAAFIGLWPN